MSGTKPIMHQCFCCRYSTHHLTPNSRPLGVCTIYISFMHGVRPVGSCPSCAFTVLACDPCTILISPCLKLKFNYLLLLQYALIPSSLIRLLPCFLFFLLDLGDWENMAAGGWVHVEIIWRVRLFDLLLINHLKFDHRTLLIQSWSNLGLVKKTVIKYFSVQSSFKKIASHVKVSWLLSFGVCWWLIVL